MIRRHVLFLFLLCLGIMRSAFADTLLILGDSLSAGYRLPLNEAWPTLLAEKYQHDQQHITVINASISGHTVAQSLEQLPDLLRQHTPKWVLVELGANDGLQGLAVTQTEQNLETVITTIQQAGSQPLLMQIRIPPNYGQRYTNSFTNMYPQLAEKYQIPLLPFFMEKIILQPELIQDDQIHPNSTAQPIIAELMAQELAPYLK